MLRLVRGKRRLLSPLFKSTAVSTHHPTLYQSTQRGIHSSAVRCAKKLGTDNNFMDRLLETMSGVPPMDITIILPGNTRERIKFADVGGQVEAKEELAEIVDFLQNRQKYADIGAKIPSGCLLTGPPGNGKTLLAKAVAGECSVPFVVVAGPQFIDRIGGLGPKRIRNLFKKCRELAPCILFIDEIDAVAPKRAGQEDTGHPAGVNTERESTLNQLLVELDGLHDRQEIFVMAATNRDEVLDNAVTRPGRLDRKVYIDNPEEEERIEIFKIHMRSLKLRDPQVWESYCKRLAASTPGYSGADIANICNEAAMHAARFAKAEITQDDFEKAIERVTAGLEKVNPSVTEEEMKMFACYTATKGIISLALPTLNPILKMSVVPRQNRSTGGFTQFHPKRDFLHTKDRILDSICLEVSGRAAEKIFYGRNTTQAQNDLDKATKMAYAMVSDHGMGISAPNLSFRENRSQIPRKVNLWSDKLQLEMDTEVRTIVKAQYDRAKTLINKHKELFTAASEALFTAKTLNQDAIQDLILKHGNPFGAPLRSSLPAPPAQCTKEDPPECKGD